MDEPVIELDAEQAALRRRDAAWVRQCLAGDQQAFGQLYDAWFDRVFDLVNRVVRDRDVAAEVAQEAFFSAWRNLGTLEKPEAFGGWLLRIARNGAYNRSQKEQRSYSVDDEGLSVIESVGASSTGAPSGFGVEDRLGRAVTPGAAVEDAEIVSLVWQAAEALPDRDLEVLDLQLRHGLTPAEIGDVMGMNRNAANQLVHRLKSRLEHAIKARVLWRGGSPSCEVLAQRLRDLGIERFSAEAVRVTERHVPGCIECDERQRLHLEPAALFAAVPLFAVPLALKQTAAAALAASGVPMGGSAFLTAAGIAGHAAGSVGSIAGGAVDPGVGANVGHAVSAPGVDPNLGANVGHAIGGSSSGVGGNVGHAVSAPGAPGSGAPGAGLGDAAGHSLASPTPIDAAASYAGNAVEAGDAATAAAKVAGPPPPASNLPRILALSAAAVFLLALLFGGGLWWGSREDAELIASGPPVSALGSVPSSTTTSTVQTSTSTSDPATTDSTAAPTTPTTRATTPTTRATTPTTAPTTPPTRPTTTTTQPTTTTTAPPEVVIDITPPTGNTNGIPWAGRPTLSWSVTPSQGYTVTVTGLDFTSYPVTTGQTFTETTPSGSRQVCPGTRVNFGNGASCSMLAGPHDYVITVKNGAGQVVGSKTTTLMVVDAPIK